MEEHKMTHSEDAWMPKDGDFVTCYYISGTFVSIFRGNEEDNCYARLKISGPDKGSLSYLVWSDGLCLKCRLATASEKQQLLDALRRKGQRWNPEGKCIEDFWEPEDGDFVTYVYKYRRITTIYKEKKESEGDNAYALVYVRGPFVGMLSFGPTSLTTYLERVPAQYYEGRMLIDELNAKGIQWDPEKKKIVGWEPVDGEEFWYISATMGVHQAIYMTENHRLLNLAGNRFRTEAEALAMAEKFQKILNSKKDE